MVVTTITKCNSINEVIHYDINIIISHYILVKKKTHYNKEFLSRMCKRENNHKETLKKPTYLAIFNM